MRVISAVVLGALIGSCAHSPSPLDEIRTLGELRVITQNTPTTFYNGATEPYGIEYELVSAFADHLGVRLQLTDTLKLGDIYTSLADGRAHIAAAGLLQSDLYGDDIAFGPGYQSVTANVIYRMGEQRPAALSDLIGKSVEVRAGSSYAGLLRDTLEQHPALGFAENASANPETLIRRVADGTIDFAIIKSNEFSLLRNYYPEVQIAFELESVSELAWALPKADEELRDAVGEFFARIRATGELDTILDRYYDEIPDFDFVGARAFVRHLNERYPNLQASFEQAERETGIDSRLLAAMAYQESHWDPDAVSPTGVQGLMMLTAKTAEIVGVENRADPHESIMGGARYLVRVLEKFPERIPYDDRLMMAVAAYNVGFGHVEDARIITESLRGDKDSWESVREHLPLLADEAWYPHLERGYAQGTVPVHYVDNVQNYYWFLDRLNGTEVFASLPEPDAETEADDDSI